MGTAWATATERGWTIQNRRIRVGLEKSTTGGLNLVSLENLASGHNWARPGGPVGELVEMEGEPAPATGGAIAFGVDGHEIRESSGGSVELEIRLRNGATGAMLRLLLRCYPDAGVIELKARLENHGHSMLPPVLRLSPLCFTLRPAPESLRFLTSDPSGRHGFVAVEPAVEPGTEVVDDWLAIHDAGAGESLLVGGDLGAGVLGFQARARRVEGSTLVSAGPCFRAAVGGSSPSAYQVAPGESAETPLVFLSLASGGVDCAANEGFRYLKRWVFPERLPDTPAAAYCVWLTQRNTEEALLRELALAKRLGFDVFYHDASWFSGGSTVPGTNDWSAGLGSYEEDCEKFPHGLASLASRVREAGLKFGLWVDPGNVESRRVASGEIPETWVAMIDGKPLECLHPSLSPMTQLCLGNPQVVEWIKGELARIVELYRLEWIKWDPSGTVSHACTRDDHGHHARNGAHAAYEGKMEVWAHLLGRFPRLSGFECEPSLRYSRINPGPRALLPGGYTNQFIVGPMTSPLVWGSLAGPQHGDTERLFGGDWYGVSALDYRLRLCLMHGISFGNINGSAAQVLSAAPPGYLEALERNLIAFRRYRHLLFEDVFHPELASPHRWSCLEYVTPDGSEAVVFLFRHQGGSPENRVRLQGLDPSSSYILRSLNDRPGRERTVRGAELTDAGLPSKLPDEWLARGDGLPGTAYEDQLEYGSDVVLLCRAAGA